MQPSRIQNNQTAEQLLKAERRKEYSRYRSNLIEHLSRTNALPLAIEKVVRFIANAGLGGATDYKYAWCGHSFIARSLGYSVRSRITKKLKKKVTSSRHLEKILSVVIALGIFNVQPLTHAELVTLFDRNGWKSEKIKHFNNRINVYSPNLNCFLWHPKNEFFQENVLGLFNTATELWRKADGATTRSRSRTPAPRTPVNNVSDTAGTEQNTQRNPSSDDAPEIRRPTTDKLLDLGKREDAPTSRRSSRFPKSSIEAPAPRQGSGHLPVSRLEDIPTDQLADEEFPRLLAEQDGTPVPSVSGLLRRLETKFKMKESSHSFDHLVEQFEEHISSIPGFTEVDIESALRERDFDGLREFSWGILLSDRPSKAGRTSFRRRLIDAVVSCISSRLACEEAARKKAHGETTEGIHERFGNTEFPGYIERDWDGRPLAPSIRYSICLLGLMLKGLIPTSVVWLVRDEDMLGGLTPEFQLEFRTDRLSAAERELVRQKWLVVASQLDGFTMEKAYQLLEMVYAKFGDLN